MSKQISFSVKTRAGFLYLAMVPSLCGSRGQFPGRWFFHRLGCGDVGDSSGSNASNGGWWRTADKASLTHPPAILLLLCGQFLTGHRQYWPKAQGLGTSALHPQKSSDIWLGCYTKVFGLNSLENKKNMWGYGIYIVMTLLILKL